MVRLFPLRVMVLARVVAVLVVACVGGARCLSLEGVRPPHGPPRPLSPLPLRHRLDPDLTPDDLQALAIMPDQIKVDPAALRYEEALLLQELQQPHSPASYRLQQIISELAEAATAAEDLEGGAEEGPSRAEVKEAEAAAVAGPWENAADPRYFVVNDYLSRGGDEAGSSRLGSIRKARDSRNSRSISSSSNKDSTITDNSNSSQNTNSQSSNSNNGMFKRAWPPSFSRRRSSGLSLSIDASMKVLREALYLEIARKKQRQQLQRAQHNKALLNTIGKRDVTEQLRNDEHLRAMQADRD